MTLYLFTNDTTAGREHLLRRLRRELAALHRQRAAGAAEGVEGELTLITRTDGTTQVAYNGIPLYYWVRRHAAGR